MEQKEKEKRQLNIIIIVHNIEESAAIQEERYKCTYKKYLGISTTIPSAFRLGKKSRLLKLSLNNIQDKGTILKNKTKLRSLDNPYVHKIFITPDFTPLEQRQKKALCQQLAAMDKDKKLYVMKIVQRAT